MDIGEQSAARHRAKLEVDFWLHIDFLKSSQGISEQEALDGIRSPGWTGRRARPAEAQRQAEDRERQRAMRDQRKR